MWVSKSLSSHDGKAKKDTYIRDIVKEKKNQWISWMKPLPREKGLRKIAKGTDMT